MLEWLKIKGYRKLKYKAKFKGKQFYQVNIFYPSSQTCSICNCVSKKYKNLNERIYSCPNCKNELDRDLNASINIMFEGLKLYMNIIFLHYKRTKFLLNLSGNI